MVFSSEGQPDSSPLGRALCVTIPADARTAGSAVKVSIHYTTTAASSALQFLSPAQTAGKAHPFLFTQCQAIHARSLLPCQDTPAVKSTYTARVAVPTALRAVMSALATDDGEAVVDGEDAGTTIAYSFRQPVVVPSYLIALAVGDLRRRELSPRVAVWAEPSVVDEAADEFAETEAFVAAGESLLGPYDWTRYDLLVLPPSFPYGGMENPCLTFVTPTLLARDRSLTSVVAHEISHSWTGNLVSCATWEHFWLNEGFTMMAERKIVSRVSEASASAHWGDLRGDDYFEFDALAGWTHLAESIALYERRGEMAYTALIPDLTGVDPDDAFSSVPYEKGFYFLAHIQAKVGGAARFNPWFYAWIQEHRQQSVTSQRFREHITAWFRDEAKVGAGNTVELETAIDWDAWFYGVGNPPVTNSYDETKRRMCTELAEAWAKGDLAAVPDTDARRWSSRQLVVFLDRLLELSADLKSRGQRMGAALLATLDDRYELSGRRNCEVR